MKTLLKLHNAIGNSLLARGVKKTYQWFLFASGAAIVLAMLATVLLRYVFKTNLFGIEEIILTVAMWFYFLGGANGSMEDSQISADIVSVFIKSEKVRRWLSLFTRVIEIVVLVFFIVMTVRLLAINFVRYPTTQGLKIPFVVPQMAILVGFVLMLLYSLGHFVDDLGSKPEDGSPRDEIRMKGDN